MTEHKSHVPALRFPDFSGEWKESLLGKESICLDSKRVPLKESDRAKKHGIYPYYGASGVIDYIDEYIFDEPLILLAEDGANIINRSTPVAFIARGKYWVNNHAHVYRANGSTEFLALYLENLTYEKYNTGTAQPKLNGQVCKELPIMIPSLPEQEKIAAFLGVVDARVEQLRRKQALLEQYKKGVMQRIFSGQIRFTDDHGNPFPDWQEKRLGDTCEIRKGEQLNRDDMDSGGLYPVLNGGIRASGYTTEWNMEENTISISEGGNSCGYVNYIREKFWCGGHCYALINLKENVELTFLFQVLKHTEAEIMRLRVGSGLPNIQKKDLTKHVISLPHPDEQRKIADFLSAIDSKIDSVAEEVVAAQNYKKSLLQQMFV